MPKPRSARPALPRLAAVRQWHGYISMFVAPSLIFFAATGALQTFRVPDKKEAPVLLQKLARLHKDDVFAVKPPRPPRKPDAARTGPVVEKPAAKTSTEILKWFFTAVSIGVVITTLLGVWMGLTQSRRKPLLLALLAVGTAAPVLILLA